ncbi:cupin domain-containing protein [uncultured Tateyamaria sp.]|uniref:cupin domain-containing protein n=1 Tax=uncultured Tateyamaria sp. TaxID=455651 RepID=UPI00260FDE83|nr:cupin domain-containing protein [uncultured Tateyamaria sp.]
MPASLLDIDDATGVTRHPDPAIVRSGDGSSTLWNRVDLGSGVLMCGQWVGQPGELDVRPRAHHEMFTVIRGLVELIEEDGSVVRVGPGQAGFIPMGWTGIWRTVEETQKSYMLLKVVLDAGP